MARARGYARSAAGALARVRACQGTPGLGGDRDAVLAAALACLEEACCELRAIRCQRGGWMTLEEAERYARVREGSLREAARAGEVRCYRRAAHAAAVVSAADVDEWVRTSWLPLAEGGDL